MYEAGQRVVYGIHGVCRVADTEVRTVDKKRVTYLVLEPEGQAGARYLVPTHNEAAMSRIHPMLTTQELENLLSSEAVRADAWIPEENLRKQAYRSLISCGDRAALLSMVRTLWLHKSARSASGKKFHQCDENFLRDAEKLLCGEIALVLGISPEEAKAYLRRTLAD